MKLKFTALRWTIRFDCISLDNWTCKEILLSVNEARVNGGSNYDSLYYCHMPRSAFDALRWTIGLLHFVGQFDFTAFRWTIQE